MKTKRTVLLTGATGTMGTEVRKALRKHPDRFHLLLFLRDSKKNRKHMKNEPGQRIIWGDLKNREDAFRGVRGVDIILHIGALVSPMADAHPEEAWKVNVEGTKHLVDAIKELPETIQPAFVYIGSVAQTGNRAVPVHWGRIGDPLIPSIFDHYAQTKIAAERYVIEAGLRKWVSLRQTGILHQELLQTDDGISFHQPLNNHLEWVTAEDSARLLMKLCLDDVPDRLWNNVYNIGGGDSFRLSAYEFLRKIFSLLSIDMRDILTPDLYALRNFHGQYYLDSDELEKLLPFRQDTFEDYLERVRSVLPLWLKMAKWAPKTLVRRLLREQCLRNPRTPLYWLKHDVKEKIEAFFGSKKAWEEIGGWEDFVHIPDAPHMLVSHGYDEQKPATRLQLEDMKEAARFRGGECLSQEMDTGDWRTKLHFVCSQGHSFHASPFLILRAGHWCETCVKNTATYEQQARKSPFMAQVWRADHPIENTFSSS